MRRNIIYVLVLLFSLSSLAAFAAAGAGASKAFNPDISANFLGLVLRDTRGSNLRTDARHNGISFQEGELQFTADVDPYFRASALFSVAQKDNSTDFGIDPEEVYAESIALPVVTVRIGKFKAALGKNNQLHTHAYPFIDQPLINQDLLGTEGLNEAGVSAAALVPAPWFVELTLQGLGTNNAKIFNSQQSGDYAGVASLKNLWDLSDSATFEFTVFGTEGPNAGGGQSYVYGSDAIMKWRPAEGGKYKALIWQTEYLRGNLLRQATPQLSGIASWLQYQFAERWWVQARAEYEGLQPKSMELGSKRKQSLLLGFFPSEFSGFRVQYDHLLADGQKDGHDIALQWNFSIGAHPAHAY